MANLKGCFSHKSDDWKTPKKKKLYDRIMELGYIDTFKFHSDINEFEQIYKKKKLYCNPPFSKMNQIPKWIETQLKNKCDILLLIPARTDTKYFHELLKMKPMIYFIRGRLHYNDQGTAPFPSIIMMFSNKTSNLLCHELYKLSDII